MPDYENDIVFKPKLSWDELCEWAKDKVKKIEGGVIYVQFGDGNEVLFNPYHSIEFYNEDMWCEVRRNVSYDRMKTIIQALYEE